MLIFNELFIEAFIKYFVVLNPISIIGPFMLITKSLAENERKQLRNQSLILAYLILIGTVILGKVILNSLDISTYSLKIAGGLLFFKFGFDSMQGNLERHQVAKTEPNLVPLAFPIIAGPGSVTVSIVMTDATKPELFNFLSIIIAISLTFIIIYLILANSELIDKSLGPKTVSAITTIMGLLIMTIGVQLILAGIQEWLFSAKIN